ncbi:hypothetical protein [Clostridium senegalense]|uniref:hypothetical protein n=1 Tax=Clostridium senegalense TaxID=1465809 RepID=UPI001FD53290|nr:hypothetical protein [Clostridium senegalense]
MNGIIGLLGGGAVDELNAVLVALVKGIQSVGVPAVAIAFSIGGIYHIFGGPEGTRKAKPWYIGAVVGLLVLLGAGSFSTYLEEKMEFSEPTTGTKTSSIIQMQKNV